MAEGTLSKRGYSPLFAFSPLNFLGQLEVVEDTKQQLYTAPGQDEHSVVSFLNCCAPKVEQQLATLLLIGQARKQKYAEGYGSKPALFGH